MKDVVEIMARAIGCVTRFTLEYDQDPAAQKGAAIQAKAALSALDAAGYAVVPKEAWDAAHGLDLCAVVDRDNGKIADIRIASERWARFKKTFASLAGQSDTGRG